MNPSMRVQITMTAASSVAGFQRKEKTKRKTTIPSAT